ncbi:MAG: UDP-N-acetylglucosamine 1-carboxyvinyltransferase [Ignavibacteriales bacterium]|nr:UDP-N-acetylglucosamine 1-carboxyvinyltransferase [Ignavibacteriales bacterium]MCB9218821.1 UDP-N-acetylglucosamine 1-carboxyvinyltransferase [Ignavibacteriales bacterium]
MDKFVIKGGISLKGTVEVSGAKNSALALMPSVLLNNGINKITNVPEVNDIFTMMKLLNQLGVNSKFENQTLTLDSSKIISQTAPYEHVKKMRASVYVLGPLLAKYGKAKVSMPGGCAWGPRPINLHLEAMKKLGAEIELEEGYIVAKSKKLMGARINFDISSVGATGNALMAAVLAKGETIITNAAAEPEITQLAQFLVSMGANIEGIGSNILEIQGVIELKSAEVENIPDRIEAGTLLIAAAMTKGKIKLTNVNSKHLNLVIQKLEDSGVKLTYNNNLMSLDASNIEPKNVDVTTAVYPGFPTDMQAQWTAFMCIVNGSSKITDTIYLDRFKHIPELARLGANIEILRNSAIVKGVKKLNGATVMSTDLRASASLVLAGLVAKGTTEVLRIYHLDRGYQRIEEKLKKLGARIERVKTEEF